MRTCSSSAELCLKSVSTCSQPSDKYPGSFSATGLFGRFPFALPTLIAAILSLLGKLILLPSSNHCHLSCPDIWHACTEQRQIAAVAAWQRLSKTHAQCTILQLCKTDLHEDAQ